jgi:hypothetical protein
VEETPDTIYLVLPPGTSPAGRGGEISDRELESVAGGRWEPKTDTEITCVVACPLIGD